MDGHDNNFYFEDYNSKRLSLTWESVQKGAFIWSTKAREFIQNHDNKCLKEEIKRKFNPRQFTQMQT